MIKQTTVDDDSRRRQTKMSKRRRVVKDPSSHQAGLLGEMQLTKPFGNKDVPKDAQILNVNYIGPGQLDGNMWFPAGSSHQAYGDVFEFSFPDYFQDPLFNEAIIPPTKMMPTNEIFDVDFECLPKVPRPKAVQLRHELVTASPDPWSVRQGAVVTGYNEKSTDGRLAVRYPVGTQLDYEEALQGYPTPFMVYVVGKGKQKALGHWIQKHVNSSTGKFSSYIDMWLFDSFCNEVRPIWAKYFYPRTSSIRIPKTQKIIEGQPVVPMDDERFEMTGFEWAGREFHRFQGYGGSLTATDSYARKLLLGTIGPYNFEVFHFARFRIYYQPTKVQADTLFFQSQQEFVFEQFRGDRHEYETPMWSTNPRETLTDALLKGVITCQKGNIEYFQDGKLNAKDASTNILQDEASSNTWY